MRFAKFLVVLLLVGIGALMAMHVGRHPDSPEDARAMAERAASFVESHGRDEALAAFADPEGDFVDERLFVFAVGLDGTMLAHPFRPKMVGRLILGERDFNGVAYGREMVSVARTDGRGWVDYVGRDPIAKRLRRKTTYVLKVDDMLVACGAFSD